MLNHKLIKPGVFEIYYGAMKSGKTKALLDRIEQLHFLTDCDVLIVKPEVDTRDIMLKSRFSNKQFESIVIDENNPQELLEHITDRTVVVAIDEIQFFNSKIIGVIEHLQKNDINVIAAGLNTDFRGLPFGSMGHLLAMSDEAFALAGVCDVEGCNRPGSRTQRLINNEPAHFDSPVVLIEGSGDEIYETRCIHHHEVLGKPEQYSFKKD